MDLREVDLLGFSLGSFVAQEIALIRPDLLRRVVLASRRRRVQRECTAGRRGSSAPSAAGDDAVGIHLGLLRPTDTSREAGQQAAGRIFGEGRPSATSRRRGRPGQYDGLVRGAFPTTPCSSGRRDRPSGVRRQRRQRPDDPAALLVPFAGLLPDARVKIYPDSAHGFLFQHHGEFAADVVRSSRRRLMPMIDVYAAPGTFHDTHASPRPRSGGDALGAGARAAAVREQHRRVHP